MTAVNTTDNDRFDGFHLTGFDGTRRLVERYTNHRDNPPPRAGKDTSDEGIRQILRSVDIEVDRTLLS
jgi:hypothetical protein